MALTRREWAELRASSTEAIEKELIRAVLVMARERENVNRCLNQVNIEDCQQNLEIQVEKAERKLNEVRARKEVFNRALVLLGVTFELDSKI